MMSSGRLRYLFLIPSAARYAIAATVSVGLWPAFCGNRAEALKLLRQVDNAKDLTETLRGRDYPSLSLESVLFQGEYHLTTMPAPITRKLLMVFDETDS